LQGAPCLEDHGLKTSEIFTVILHAITIIYHYKNSNENASNADFIMTIYGFFIKKSKWLHWKSTNFA